MTETQDYQVETVYRCMSCEAVHDEEAGPLYECSSCGSQFNRDNSADGGSNRCPQCNKFGARAGDFSCVDCGEEAEEVQAVQIDDSSDEWLVLEGEGTVEEQIAAAVAKQQEEERQQAERERRKAEAAEAMKRRYDAAPVKTGKEIQVGDCLLIDDDRRIYEYVVGYVGPDTFAKGDGFRVTDGSGPTGFGFNFKPDDRVKYDPEGAKNDVAH